MTSGEPCDLTLCRAFDELRVRGLMNEWMDEWLKLIELNGIDELRELPLPS